MAPPGRDPQFVLEHSGYVRELVRRLVFDPEVARDVEQETWLAALRHEPPQRGSARAWLATIARHFAYRAWRAKARREERELDPLPQPTTPTPAEILGREALRREVVDALLALDEPWRETLVLHFLEELSTSAVAERMGVPLETVRTRVKRGLELLRARLERRTSLHGAALSLALVEAWRIGPPPLSVLAASVSSLSVGAVLMSTAGKSVLAVAAALALLAAYRFASQSDPATPDELHAAAQVETQLTTSSEPVAESVSKTSARTELAAKPVVPSAPAPQERPRLGSLLVRTRWSDGHAPAANVGFVLHPSNTEDFYRDATRHVTGPDGSVLIEGVPPGNVSLYSDRGSYARGEAKAGEVTEVELVLPQGFTLKGRVLDIDRSPLPNAEVFLWQCIEDPDQGWVIARSDARGEYSARGLYKGVNFISARAPGRAPTKQRLVMSNEGTTVSVDLVFEALGGAVRGRVLDPDGAPVGGAIVVLGGEEGSSMTRMPDGTEAREPAGRRITSGPDGSFEVDGVAAGKLEVRARGRGLAPWRGSLEVDAGRMSSLEIRLERGGRIEGVVRDDRGAPVSRAEVDVVSASELEGGFRRTAADGTFTLAGLSLGDVELRVAHDELGTATQTVTVSESEIARTEIVLSRGRTLLVRIEGNVADWVDGYVQATAPSSDSSNYFHSAKVDSRGIAELIQCPEAPMHLELFAPGDSMFPRAVLDGVLASAGEVVIRPDPAKVGSIRIAGRVIDARGEPVGSAQVMPSLRNHWMSPIEGCDAESGRFELGPYAPGEWLVSIDAVGFVRARTALVTLAAGDTHDFGDIVLQRGTQIAVVGLRRAEGVKASLEGPGGELRELKPARGRWLSDSVEEGRWWLVTGGGNVALQAQRVDIAAVGGEQEVRVIERVVAPRRLRLPDTSESAEARLEVRDSNGVRLGVFDLDAELAVDVPLANGRYTLRALAGERELGSRTLEVSDDHAPELIELSFD